ncbi:division/cell wall cluster transcriptional repressor MraZ [Candidatus Viridilinea mediisalina]|uniref:Transcriptional regulator MraZ n=1 Tax=Candidatus Viridilinea mediisalina TaxID=2024553 RepID=A0A2A6RKT7_9CHLR|nr:cell division/cell wall cluster transcriptional repressor MraZ [Candidatus Viridilinea mediisalina]PDW03515.1 hypothetical protein CJ255_08515 [Candidatus Viridilinea mediisalina]
MLFGTWRLDRTSDGRFVLPSAWHAVTSAGLTITRGFEPCLQLFPLATWQPLAQRVSSLPLTAAAARMLRRLLFSAAAQLVPDAEACVAIPPRLLAYANLAAGAVAVGMVSYVELWSPECLAQGECSS